MDHELDELKREFLAEAEQKVREMQTALCEKPTREALERLAYLAHQLKGSGGSYGYQRISTDAAEIERAVESGDASLNETVARYVTSLQAEIERGTKELAAHA